jgi:DNA (cytosine-5)-methyltransferase 1
LVPVCFDPAQITSAANRTRVAVRRLTPRECERLQGFPDDWTLVTHRGKPAADSPRYKAIGNSIAVPVLRWIGERIAAVEAHVALPGERARQRSAA